MDAAAREKKLFEMREELMHERGVAAMGGAPPNPGKIRALRKNIARIHTIQSEEAKLGGRAAPEPKAERPDETKKPTKPKKAAEGTPEEPEKGELEDDEEEAA